MTKQKRVFIAMSGGVDSTVSAVRLLEEGYQVSGIYMETWKDPEWLKIQNNAKPPAEKAEEAAQSIGIPFVLLDVQDRFYQTVVQNFIQQYVAGQTPNPCLFCNPQIKWGILQSYAFEQGADFFATGHYARIHHASNGSAQLLRGADRTKDQSYVLALLSQKQLNRSLLPLGELSKVQVREQARALGLPVADRPDSQDLCFLGTVNYRDFLHRYAPGTASPGEIVDLDGIILGEHEGLAFYTIGQRRGIRIAAPEPYYVVSKESHSNRLIVGYAHQAMKSHLRAIHPNWIADEPPDQDSPCEVMIRYRAEPVLASVIAIDLGEYELKLSQPLNGITPGQVAVLYQGDMCLGGGLIHSAW
jgi:tRNA-uridine 2-sulfurtransferase